MSKKFPQKKFIELLPLSLQMRTEVLEVLSIMMNQDLIKKSLCTNIQIKSFFEYLQKQSSRVVL